VSSHQFEAVIFDLDGVVTQTAALHARAWKATFDEYFARREPQEAETSPRFDIDSDYRMYVDGKPRLDGVRSYLSSVGIILPEGDPGDSPGAETVHGLGKRKDELFVTTLRRDGVTVFASTIGLIHGLQTEGIKAAVVTSSRNGREVLRIAGIEDLFAVRLDGIDAEVLQLEGKPNPAVFLKCAELLSVTPDRAVLIEDSIAGVDAGCRGAFGLVVGVNRGHNRDALAANGADLVVSDVAELSIEALDTSLREKRESSTAWQIEQEGFDLAREREMESIFTVGNGYLGVRGSLDSPLPASQGDLFIAGVYDRKQSALPYSELEFLAADRGNYPYSELVSAPFPFRFRLTIENDPLDLAGPHWRVFRRVLDLRRGILHNQIAFTTSAGRRTLVDSQRCASMANLHLLLQQITVQLENYSAAVEMDASLTDPDLKANHPHLVVLDSGEVDPGLEVHQFATRASSIKICIAARTTPAGSGKDAVRWQLPGAIAEELVFRRAVLIYTSRDSLDPLATAIERLRAMSWADFDGLFDAHASCWNDVWNRANVQITGSAATVQALRFNSYHLTIAADRDPRVSVGGRALTGRAYEGHVFWDVEIFKLPFYVHNFPDVARCLLEYRYHTLGGARLKAHQLGCRGACYAWESTTTGEEVTPQTIRLKSTGVKVPIFTGTQQVHVTAGVSHGVWRYWEATRDASFMRDAGVEILVETARFWTTRSTRDAHYFHIQSVMGPDEYHHSVDDNAYTNWMARFNLERAVDGVEWIKHEFPQAWNALAERLHLTLDEPGEWAAVARGLYIPAPNPQGVIEQFAGFFKLKDYRLPREERFRAPIHRLFEWERINQLRVIKQADVLMLLHLFPEAFSREVMAANYNYYEPITDHGSSLSPGIHAAVAARLGLREDAQRYWRQSLWLDLSDSMANSSLGVHPACMGATWQALVFGFLGIRFTEGGPVCDPDAKSRFPEKWRALSLQLAWRGSSHLIEIPKEIKP
jgi:beta-phosphoglucomutase family hydrolase